MASPSVTYTFTNGTSADASQVNTNFTDVINGITDGSKDLSISALTCAGAVAMNGAVTLGNATGDDITVTGYVASDILPKADGAYDLGASGRAFAEVHTDKIVAQDATSAVPGLVKATLWQSIPNTNTVNIGPTEVTDWTKTLTNGATYRFTIVGTFQGDDGNNDNCIFDLRDDGTSFTQFGGLTQGESPYKGKVQGSFIHTMGSTAFTVYVNGDDGDYNLLPNGANQPCYLQIEKLVSHENGTIS
jgi:hypothetical protein